MQESRGRTRTLILRTLIVACCVHRSIGRPTEQPTKFTLSTGEESSGNPALRPVSRLEQGQEFLGRVADVVRIGRGRLVNSVSLARNIVADRAETLVSEAQNNVASVVVAKSQFLEQGRKSLEAIQNVPVLNFQSSPRETVRLESEVAQAPLERPVSKSLGGVLEAFFRPTPLVDRIREEEKYGNSGDKFIGIGRALVSGFEGFSNFLNTVVDFPKNAVNKKSSAVTGSLNQLGARLIGLE